MALKPGTTLGHYEVASPVGKGGMGEVYRARDTKLDRDVALKVLPGPFTADPDRMARFEREAKVLASLNHPHICTVYDLGREAGVDYIVMEYLDGEVLADRLKRGALPAEDVVRFGVEIAEALHEAHRAGIVHRDLKPANIIVTRHGVKLLDFGVARIVHPGGAPGEGEGTTATSPPSLTQAGALIGTVPYMAPEQLEGQPTDARTDLFALGTVLYEMITGRPAFSGTSQARLISAILTGEPTEIGVVQPAAPPAFAALVRRCLAKAPAERWPAALDVARELEGLSLSRAPDRPAPPPIREAAFRIEYFKSADGGSVAAARGGKGKPLLVVPTMVDTIETSWNLYAGAFPGRELITYDRRGTGLSERESAAAGPEVYLQDAQAVIDSLATEQIDVLGTLLGTTEAAWLASRNPSRIQRLVLRAPTLGLDDWSSIPGVRAALAAMEEDWEFFCQAFAQFVVGWGHPNAPAMAERLRRITSRDELRAMLQAFKRLDLVEVYGTIRIPTLVEHHPGYFFPDLYSRRIASMIPDCRMAVFAGDDGEFIGNLGIAAAFLGADRVPGTP